MIKGGLGNQLFAYAAARAYSIRTSRDLMLDDVSGYKSDSYDRAYKLDRFPIAGSVAPPRWRLGDPRGPRHKTIRSFNKLLPNPLRSYLAEDQEQPETQLTGFISNRVVVRLNGYWQSEKYFFERASTIRTELQPPPFEEGSAEADLEAELAGTPSVFLHIRRDRYSPRLGSGYYDSSITSALSTLGTCRFEVFGDDLGWAQQYLDFHGAPVRYHEASAEELVDFRLMAACRHAIVANSSFSWWAAWLRRHADKRVFTPSDPGWPLKPGSEWTKVPNRLEY